jgi:hypothetical protein
MGMLARSQRQQKQRELKQILREIDPYQFLRKTVLGFMIRSDDFGFFEPFPFMHYYFGSEEATRLGGLPEVLHLLTELLSSLAPNAGIS